jgi:hypothetical protein
MCTSSWFSPPSGPRADVIREAMPARRVSIGSHLTICEGHVPGSVTLLVANSTRFSFSSGTFQFGRSSDTSAASNVFDPP